ncbi:MAG: N-acetyltransferase [Alphaproteobacteria bacterium]|nr:N-acetyltransferase [Alphaproteobacteria bacterium]
MPPKQTTIRPRARQDDGAIASVIEAAFGGQAEVALVEALRRDGDMVLERVAEEAQGGLVGHIAFSRLSAEGAGQSLRAVALAPLAVAPALQRKGIGDALTRTALTDLRNAGEEIAVVLGHPAYYPRFGFSNLQAKRLEAPFSGASFMALELRPGALADHRWRITYARAFETG